MDETHTNAGKDS